MVFIDLSGDIDNRDWKECLQQEASNSDDEDDSDVDSDDEDRDDKLLLSSGPITLALATAIRELMEGSIDKSWSLVLSSCYPQDEEVVRELSKAFSSKIYEIEIMDVEGADRLIAMMRAAFRLESYTNVSTHLKFLNFFDLLVLPDAALLMRSILQHANALEVLSIKKCRFLGTESHPHPFEVIFEGLDHKPRRLEFHNMQLGDFGGVAPLSQANEWQGIRELAFYSVDMRCVPDLSKFTNLDTLSIVDESRVYSLVELEASNLLQLLERSDCKLAKLSLHGTDFDSFGEHLLTALKGCTSIEFLDLRNMKLDDCVDAFLECVQGNRSLRTVEFSNSGVNNATLKRLATILENKNATLQSITPFSNHELLRTQLFRNWSGRKILSAPPGSVPLGLWPLIFARVDFDTFRKTQRGRTKLRCNKAALCADAVYHLVRNCSVFDACKRKRDE